VKSVAYISMGSNLDDRLSYLKGAIDELNKDERISIKKISSIYETDPIGYTNQGNFLNIVAKLETDYEVEQLLRKCLQIELQLGRERKIRWGPRTIDLDILLYNQENIETDDLNNYIIKLKKSDFKDFDNNIIKTDINQCGVSYIIISKAMDKIMTTG